MNHIASTLRKSLAPLLLLAAAAIAGAACASDGQRASPTHSASPSPSGTRPHAQASPANAADQRQAAFQPVIVSTDLAVGGNRFVIGIVDTAKMILIEGAEVRLRFFRLNQDGTAVLKAEAEARPLVVPKNYTHVHDDGVPETHEAGSVSVYVANVDFDSPGQWGVEITASLGGKPLTVLGPQFGVSARSTSIAVGEPAPRTVQQVLGEGGDIFDLDTSNPPDPHMHTVTIADAVTSGRPSVIVFSSPGICTSQTCGPMKDVVDQLYVQYEDRASFVHVEPYDLEKARGGQGLYPSRAMSEWGLKSEPWIFLVDAHGRVAAKFEGMAGFDEVRESLEKLAGRQ